MTLSIGIEGTQTIAQKLAHILLPSDCVALHGDLGAGKTLMAESIIQALHGGDIAVISPTFNLLQTYDVEAHGEKATVWHYDLYRLEEPEELPELGLDDAFEDGITLIEWPEIAVHYLPVNTIHVTIEFTEHGENRDITINSSAANQPRLERAGLC